jgi:hypothetical protein
MSGLGQSLSSTDHSSALLASSELGPIEYKSRRLERPLSGSKARMSAMGHQRTLEWRSAMSALPPKANMFSVGTDVR